MTLLVDIGNSRIKWARDDAGNLTGHGEAAWRERGLRATIAAAWTALARPRRIIASSVLDAPSREELCEFVRERWQHEVQFVRSLPSACGVVNAYPEPGRLGVDRFAALVAARAAGLRSCCVVDCGTALTIDGLTGDGRHLGGLIAPGVATMRRSLLVDTRGIRVVEGDTRLMLASETGAAVAAGTCYSLVALIDRVVHEMQM
ncbi:MAG: type III pantothenate kinase, partial [Planctomycetes bacterium]|nr:type III pantothenate kinase [Planctomycetota bacterium]